MKGCGGSMLGDGLSFRRDDPLKPYPSDRKGAVGRTENSEDWSQLKCAIMPAHDMQQPSLLKNTKVAIKHLCSR